MSKPKNKTKISNTMVISKVKRKGKYNKIH